MAKFYTSEEVDSRLAQIEAVLDGTVATHGTAILDIQETQIEQHDMIAEQAAIHGTAILNLQEEQIEQDGRLTALENV